MRKHVSRLRAGAAHVLTLTAYLGNNHTFHFNNTNRKQVKIFTTSLVIFLAILMVKERLWIIASVEKILSTKFDLKR